MSIILKALKKAEESKAKEKKTHFRAFTSPKSKKAWGLMLAALAAFLLAFFFAFYFIKGGKPSVPPLPPAEKTTTAPIVQPLLKPPSDKPEPSMPSVSNLYEEAMKSLNEKNYASAEKLLKDAIASEPDNPSFHNHMGFTLKKQSRPREAVKAYEKALRLKPDYVEAMNNMAVAMEALGQKQKAEALYKKALSINPSYAEAHLNYAILLEHKGKLKEAREHYQSFIALSNDEEVKRLVLRRLR